MPLGVADLNTTPEANDAYGNSGAMDDTGSDDLVRRTARCGGKGMERFLPQSVTSTWCARRAAERHAIILVELALIQPFDL